MSRSYASHLRAEFGSESFHMNIFEQLHERCRNWSSYYSSLILIEIDILLTYTSFFWSWCTFLFFLKNQFPNDDSISLHRGWFLNCVAKTILMTSKKGEKSKVVFLWNPKLLQSLECYKWFSIYYISLICHISNWNCQFKTQILMNAWYPHH